MKVALVGYGQWGRNIGRVLKELGVLSAVVDGDAGARERAAGQLDVDVREALTADVLDRCEAVVVATPSDQHFPVATQALSAGKHVFVEKPMALQYHESCVLLERAAEAKLALCVGHVVLFHAGFEFVQGLVRDGTLGELRYVYSERCSAGRVRSPEDVFFSLAPHDVALVLALFDRMPSSVYAGGASALEGEPIGVGVIDCAFGGARGQIHVSWLSTRKQRALTAVGTKGAATFDAEPCSIGWRRRIDGPVPWGPWVVSGTAPATGESEPIRREMVAFIEYARALSVGESPPPPRHSAERAIDTMAVLEAAVRSLGSGAPVLL